MKSSVRRQQRLRRDLEEDAIHLDANDLLGCVVDVLGGNRLSIQLETGEVCDCRIPNKFRDAIWFRKGIFIVLSSSDISQERGGSDLYLKTVLFHTQIKQLSLQGRWPILFDHAVAPELEQTQQISYQTSREYSSGNPNRPSCSSSTSSDSSSTSSDSSD